MVQPDVDLRLIERLRKRSLRVTPQRLVIHRTVCAERRHMTAEEVLSSAAAVLPGTSLPTVYATLELLEELGLVHRVPTGTGAVLFEPRLEPHGHMVCSGCGKTADLAGAAVPARVLSLARQQGFSPDHAQLLVWGLCASCAQ